MAIISHLHRQKGTLEIHHKSARFAEEMSTVWFEPTDLTPHPISRASLPEVKWVIVNLALQIGRYRGAHGVDIEVAWLAIVHEGVGEESVMAGDTWVPIIWCPVEKREGMIGMKWVPEFGRKFAAPFVETPEVAVTNAASVGHGGFNSVEASYTSSFFSIVFITTKD